MKIAVCGTQCIGKSTFIEDFIKQWPMYKLCQKPRYSDLVKSNGVKINEDGDEKSQMAILNSLADQVVYASKTEDIIFDRSVMDNLIYTMWLNANGKVSDEFVRKTIKVVRETLPFYDVLFFLPITKVSPVPFEPAPNRSNSEQYRIEIDNLFKALVHRYNTSDKVFFPFDHEMGCPAIIEIFGNREERIELAKMYIMSDGKAFSEKDNLLSDAVSEDKSEKPHIIDFS